MTMTLTLTITLDARAILLAIAGIAALRRRKKIAATR